MPVDEAQFKLAMSHFASGVTIVTTELDGTLYGMTVAAFSSLSLHPPLILVCIEKTVKTHDAIVGSGRFGVSVLSETQADVSNRFASRAEDKFAGIGFRLAASGVPLIDGAITQLDCRLTDQLPGGDHTIFAGEVEEVRTAEGAPLVYYRSGYRELRF